MIDILTDFDALLDSEGGVVAGAVALLAQGRHDLAERDCEAVLAGNPASGDAHLLLSRLRLESGDLEGALEAASASVRLAHRPELSNLVVGLALRELEQDDRAALALEAAVAAGEPTGVASYLLAEIYQEWGRTALARAAFTAAVERNPLNGLACLKLAALESREHHPEAALAYVQAALQAVPTIVNHAALGDLHFCGGRMEAARDAYLKAVALGPRVADLRYKLGEAYRLLGNRQAALVELRTAMGLRPGNPEALRAIGDLLVGSAETERAETHYEQALEHDSRCWRALAGLAWIRAAREAMPEALELVRQALAVACPSEANGLAGHGVETAIEGFDRLAEATGWSPPGEEEGPTASDPRGNQRRHQRCRYTFPVDLHQGAGEAITAQILDVSRGGLLLETFEPLPAGVEVVVRLQFGVREAGRQFRGTTVRARPAPAREDQADLHEASYQVGVALLLGEGDDEREWLSLLET